MENDNDKKVEINPKEDENNENKNESGDILLSSKQIWFIYGLILAVSILPALDGGIIPANDTDIMKDMDIEQAKFGLFSSGEYFGRLFGSILFTIIISKCNRKYLLTGTLLFKSITMCMPLFTYKYIPNLIARMSSGAAQVFFNIYMPIWCDQYGLPKYRTMMVTLTNLGNPVGVLIGFGIGTLIKKWYLCFFIECILMVILSIVILLSSSLYYLVDLQLKEDTENYEAYIKPNNNEDIPLGEKTKKFMSNLGKILSNPIFLFSGLANSIEMFGADIIQFWGKNYLQEVLGITDPTKKFLIYGFICVCGPPLGFLMGGISGSYVGGYTKKWCILLCAFYSIFSGIFGTFSILPSGGIIFAVIIWIYLVFDCASIPLTIGIVIHSLPPEIKGDGFSVVNFIINLCGNFPSAYIYGLIDEKTKYKKLAMLVCLAFSYIGFIFIMIALVFRFNIKDEENNTPTIDTPINNEENQAE